MIPRLSASGARVPGMVSGMLLAAAPSPALVGAEERSGDQGEPL